MPRFAVPVFLAALLSVLAACDDPGDTNVVLPEPDVEITVTPASVTMRPGQTIQLVVTVRNADNGAVTYTSSNSDVATVTSAGVVEAVAPGVATILASSVEEPGARAAVAVTVEAVPVDAAKVEVLAPLDLAGRALDPRSVGGALRARAEVTRGSAARLEIRLRGVPVCTQEFSGTPSAGQRSTVECVFRSDAFTVGADGRASVTFPNGAADLSALLLSAEGEVLARNALPVVLANRDALALTTTVERSATDTAGRVWSGGAVRVSALPVLFGGSAIAEVSITLKSPPGSELPLGVLVAPRAASRGEDASYSAVFPAEVPPSEGGLRDVLAFLSPDAVARTAAGVEVPTRTLHRVGGEIVDEAFLRYDGVAPAPGALRLVLPSTEQWVGASYSFARGKTGESDSGVGRVEVRYFYLGTAASAGLEPEEIARRGTAVREGADLPQSAGNDAYVMVASVIDALGNASFVRLAGTTGNPITFGVDTEPPTVSFSSGSPVSGAINPSFAFGFEAADARSGVGATPYLLRVLRFLPGRTTCVEGTAESCAPVPSTDAYAVPGGDGYYRVFVASRDRAGNRSAELRRTVLRDHVAPVLTNLTIPGSLTPGQSVTFTASASDNVELRSAVLRLIFQPLASGEVLRLPLAQPVKLSPFGPDTLVASARLEQSVVLVRAIAATDASNRYTGVFAKTAAAAFEATDQAGLSASLQTAFVSGALGEPNGVGGMVAGQNTFRVSSPGGNTVVCGGCPSGTNSRITLSATAVGNSGTFANPFRSVLFFRVGRNGVPRLIGTAGTPSVAEEGSDRTWTYSVVFDAAGLPAQSAVPIFAVGIDSDGDALKTLEIRTLSIVG